MINNHVTKTTNKLTNEKEHRSDNIRLAPFFLPQAQHRKNGAKRQPLFSMKLKTVSNKSQVTGGIIGYSLIIIFLFAGFYLKSKSIWLLIAGIITLAFIIFAAIRTIRTITFYADKIVLFGPLKDEETIHLKSSKIQLNLIGGTHRIPSYTVALWRDNKKITNFRLNDSEWEFEEFYSNTSEAGYRWEISDDQKPARIKDYQIFRARKKVMELKKK